MLCNAQLQYKKTVHGKQLPVDVLHYDTKHSMEISLLNFNVEKLPY